MASSLHSPSKPLAPEHIASPFHLRVYAEILGQRRCSLDQEQIVGTLGSSLVDLNPHQIDAALKAYRGPLQTGRGVLLADEVGLGKTIEALLIMAQFWAMHRRRILLLVPASLRSQWKAEIEDKFAVPADVVDARRMRELGWDAATDSEGGFGFVVIASPQFAYSNIRFFRRHTWDLLVIDEAHRLRNVHKGTKIAKKLQETFEGVPKLLLTATPLQNSIDELYGLMTFIDPSLLGDLGTFAFRYGDARNLSELRSRIDPYMARSLRKDVREYVRFTERRCLAHGFHAGPRERSLHSELAAFLRRDRIPAFGLTESKAGAANLILIVYWRLLGSSTAAVAGALARLESRLKDYLETGVWSDPVDELDREAFTDEIEEMSGGDRDEDEITVEEIAADLEWVTRMLHLARRAETEEQQKAEELIRALDQALSDAQAAGRPQKAVIFTEFLRTQEYLKNRLEENGYEDAVTVFNGRSGSAAKRRELVDEFRRRTKVFISTEAGAEGLNLQFCNIVVNYDLPWNPQRVEQRIGRCHRYGQENDVVVCNLINLDNEAEQRLHELFQAKLNLFGGLFGASDEILGSLGSGIEFERRILDIVQHCRSADEIAREFERLQNDCEDKVKSALEEARKLVLETFDEEIAGRLKSLSEGISKGVTEHDRMVRDLVLKSVSQADIERVPEPHNWPLEVFRLRLSDDLSSVPRAPRLVTFDRVSRDVGPEIERFVVGHPLVDRLIQDYRQAPRTLVDLVLKLPSRPRSALLDDLYRNGRRTGEWLVYRITAEGSETVDHLVHVVCTHPDDSPLVGEAAERFLRADISAVLDGEPVIDAEEVSRHIAAEKMKFHERLEELFGDLYFRRREELDLRTFDEQEHSSELIRKLNDELLGIRKKASKAPDFGTKKQLMNEGDRIERQIHRARKQQNDLLDRLDGQKRRELAKLERYLEINVGEAQLVAGCRWRLVE